MCKKGTLCCRVRQRIQDACAAQRSAAGRLRTLWERKEISGGAVDEDVQAAKLVQSELDGALGVLLRSGCGGEGAGVHSGGGSCGAEARMQAGLASGCDPERRRRWCRAGQPGGGGRWRLCRGTWGQVGARRRADVAGAALSLNLLAPELLDSFVDDSAAAADNDD